MSNDTCIPNTHTHGGTLPSAGLDVGRWEFPASAEQGLVGSGKGRSGEAGGDVVSAGEKMRTHTITSAQPHHAERGWAGPSPTALAELEIL